MQPNQPVYARERALVLIEGLSKQNMRPFSHGRGARFRRQDTHMKVRYDSTPKYFRYTARLIRPFPDIDFTFTKPIRKRAASLLRLTQGNRVLDVGCGPGGSFPFFSNVWALARLPLRVPHHQGSGSKANHARDEPAAIGKQFLPVQATGRV